MSNISSRFTVEIDNIDKDSWHRLIQDFDDASIFQTWSYGEIRWGQQNISHLVLKQEARPVAAAQLRIIRMPLGGGIAYLTWGPLWRLRGSPRNPEIFSQMVRALRTEYVCNRRLLLQIHPADFGDGVDELFTRMKEEKMDLCENVSPYRTLVKDLCPSLDETRLQLPKYCRRDLGRAERVADKVNAKILTGNNAIFFEHLRNLHREMERRKGFPDLVGVDDLGLIQADLPDPLKAHIMLYEHDSKPVAALMWSEIGNRGIGLLAATSVQGRDLYSAYLLKWRMLISMKQNGCKCYDEGGYSLKVSTALFKKKWGGWEQQHMGRFEACESTALKLSIHGAFAARDASWWIKKEIAILGKKFK